MTEALIVNQLGELLQYLHKVQPVLDGKQLIFKFPNEYGASIVQHSFSYGTRDGYWELAVIQFTNSDDYNLIYSTPITSDVEVVSPEEAIQMLYQIKELQPTPKLEWEDPYDIGLRPDEHGEEDIPNEYNDGPHEEDHMHKMYAEEQPTHECMNDMLYPWTIDASAYGYNYCQTCGFRLPDYPEEEKERIDDLPHTMPRTIEGDDLPF